MYTDAHHEDHWSMMYQSCKKIKCIYYIIKNHFTNDNKKLYEIGILKDSLKKRNIKIFVTFTMGLL